eukprot:scaffold1942_cov95-Isochrysis_galbana.AAC.1
MILDERKGGIWRRVPMAARAARAARRWLSALTPSNNDHAWPAGYSSHPHPSPLGAGAGPGARGVP